MEREVLKVSAENKAEAILALETMLEIVKCEYDNSDIVERVVTANMHIR